jgi:Mg2+/Co2+ transporter CorB
MTETVMMAANRYRLRSKAAQGHKGAELAVNLLNNTDRLLGVILLFNNLVNTAAATLAGVITVELFGNDRWALGVGTLILTFFILVFSEISPKVIGAHHADRLVSIVSYPLTLVLKTFYPIVWFVNLFVVALLRLVRLQPDPQTQEQPLSPEEVRSMLLEASRYMPPKHRSILSNLFELEQVSVEDVMTPRAHIEGITLGDPPERIREQLATSYHTRIPLLDGDTERVVGVLHLRRLLGQALESGFDPHVLRSLAAKPYFVPADTSLYAQLQFFQENQQRLALVVDEYGELQGLITVEDIVEEMIGKFTSRAPKRNAALLWSEKGDVLVDGRQSLRELNRRLMLKLPLDGPKTLNGLILEHLEDIPENGVCLKVAGTPIEVVHTEDRRVRSARLFRT